MPNIQIGDLVRIAEHQHLGEKLSSDWKYKNNLWIVLELHREIKFSYSPAAATIHNGHKLLTIPQKLLEKL